MVGLARATPLTAIFISLWVEELVYCSELPDATRKAGACRNTILTVGAIPSGTQPRWLETDLPPLLFSRSHALPRLPFRSAATIHLHKKRDSNINTFFQIRFPQPSLRRFSNDPTLHLDQKRLIRSQFSNRSSKNWLT